MYDWTTEYDTAFEELKKRLITRIVLTVLDETEKWVCTVMRPVVN